MKRAFINGQCHIFDEARTVAEAARVHEPHVRAEIADFVTRRTYGETCHIRQVRADNPDFVTRAFALRSACRQAQDEIHSKRRN